MTMPGQTDHCGVGVEVGARRSVAVGESVIVEGVKTANGVSNGEGVNEGKEAMVAVETGEGITVGTSVKIAGVSLGKASGGFASGVITLRLHALNERAVTAAKNNVRIFLP